MDVGSSLRNQLPDTKTRYPLLPPVEPFRAKLRRAGSCGQRAPAGGSGQDFRICTRRAVRPWRGFLLFLVIYRDNNLVTQGEPTAPVTKTLSPPDSGVPRAQA